MKLLQETPSEIDALFRDLLIGVTSFFRDPAAFHALEEEVIPKLLFDKPGSAAVRVWTPGCSTGEEAFSIAILLQERLEKIKQSNKVQIFATDIDSQAIATARSGCFPVSIAADVMPERLARFFTAEPDDDVFRIHKTIRDMLVFSEQDVAKDPPFSRLDLISCRNLLIYMGPELQKKLIALFHYALKPGGILFLGTSETVGELADLFTVIDRKAKIFQRREDFHDALRAVPDRYFYQLKIPESISMQNTGRKAAPVKMSLRDLTEQALLQQLAPAAALVNQHGDILYLHGRTGLFLEPTSGETGVNNILKMAREGLQYELNSALHKAAAEKNIVRCPGVRVKTNGNFTSVNVTVCPVAAGEARSRSEVRRRVTAAPEQPPTFLYLVILEEGVSFDTEPSSASSVDLSALSTVSTPLGASDRIEALKKELQIKEEYLQETNEELETFNEELKSANEEMQSVNEELQSTNEELETSKEELQSVNEELATVNAELQAKVTDLSRVNNDMNNLLSGTGIGTIFVDNQMRIMRFTPASTRIINLLPSDAGRPVGHFVSNLTGYDNLLPDVQSVLDTLVPKEADVETADGRWYKMRIMPYRTLDNVIEGAVISFFDITEMKQTDEKNKGVACRKGTHPEGSASSHQEPHEHNEQPSFHPGLEGKGTVNCRCVERCSRPHSKHDGALRKTLPCR